ncbi:ATP-binding protein [Streptomyces sp. KL116D]|uniref:ATP-binding protein n=1 Tax=Streptomyces sp. KL116D TaxID=3045152 RepID=UPI003558F8EF
MPSSTGKSSITRSVHLEALDQQSGQPPCQSPPKRPAPAHVSASRVTAAGKREAHVVPHLRNVAAAWLRHSCGMPEERVQDVLVVHSELLTNAVLHGRGHSVRYRSWSPQPGLIRFEIDDGTETEEPQPQEVSPLAESGRGLLLVSLFVKELGGRWGFIEHGTTGWCWLPIHDRPASGRRQS